MKAAPGPPPPVPPTWAEIMADIANAPDTDVAFAQAPEDTPTGGFISSSRIFRRRTVKNKKTEPN